MSDAGRWRIAVDTGGTFTDCLAVAPDGSERSAKVLTSAALRGSVRAQVDERTLLIEPPVGCPADVLPGLGVRPLGAEHAGVPVADFDPDCGRLHLTRALPWRARPGQPIELASTEAAPLLAARIVSGTAHGSPLPPLELRLATTLGTNALLERRGGPVLLVVTRGFADLLVIGTQQRPDLFALDVRKPVPLAELTLEVDERLAADGSVIEELELERLRAAAMRALDSGVRSAAVALLHSYTNPRHERAVARLLRELGFTYVTESAELAPLIRLLARAQTAVVDAYLAPTVATYLEQIHGHLGGGHLQVMTSAGGLVGHDDYRAKDSLLSGPAGGVAGAAAVARRLGFERMIGFDMGGTSTDVARWDGAFEYRFEQVVGDATLVAPALAIETVAAGGGTVCWFDGQQLRVGPRSAGASPGPACYGAGGPLTVTDVNLLLGRLDPDRMTIPIAVAAAEAALAALQAEVAQASAEPPSAEALLGGLLDIVDETMAGAVRRISVGRGHDPKAHALVAFGGAGGQHATSVARRLGIDAVVVPADAGLLSAHGVQVAAVERFAVRQVLRPLAAVVAELDAMLDALATEALDAVAREGYDRSAIEIRRRMIDLRYSGQESSVTVELEPSIAVTETFERRYRALYGYLPTDRDVEVVAARVIASTVDVDTEPAARVAPPARPVTADRIVSIVVDGRRQTVAIHERRDLVPGDTIDGPALIVETHATTVLEAGWRALTAASGDLVLRPEAVREGSDAELEVARLELFTGRFDAIAVEMGELLRRTAISTNVKERRDYSCALLDADGQLVVNAPHIPVHLGSLGPCVRRVREAVALGPGDSVVTNHPDYGGSHLPDVTVVTPVHGAKGDLIGFVASRAHHAELGGTHPGSMPPDARTLAEEGVVIPPLHIERAGRDTSAAVRELLTSGPHPSRAVDENLQDLRAAVAANRHGAERLRELAHRHGQATVARYMRELADRAEARMRRALARLEPGRYCATDALDDGSPIQVAIEIRDGSAVIDFSGSAPVHPGNLNATPAIVRSAVLYVLRLLVAEPLPLNDGLLRPVELVIPEGILAPHFPDDPAAAPAIMAGNVETSQRLVDVLLRALDVVAASQGTMNNLVFGDDTFGYYETIGGGSGAGPGFAGADAVHSHMTNTRITDAELIEHRYPVRLLRFAVRRGSGGDGRWRGGDGLIRELEFLRPMQLAIVSQRRWRRPFGLAGGGDGQPGQQRLTTANGETRVLDPIDGATVGAGDRLTIETPGGGGWGRAGPTPRREPARSRPPDRASTRRRSTGGPGHR